MKGLFWLFLLISKAESIENAEGCFSQPHEIWHKTGQSAVLPCNISSHCSSANLHYQWFVFKEHEHFRLTLTSRHSLHGASLHIESLNVNDSGIYHCALSQSATKCCKQLVGPGTTLVVKEQFKTTVRHIYLWLSFIILAIYSLIIVALLILKKHGYNMTICKKTSKSGTLGSAKKKTQFHDVLQELHSKGNFGKSKQTRGNPSRVEAESNNVSTDDIYQNV